MTSYRSGAAQQQLRWQLILLSPWFKPALLLLGLLPFFWMLAGIFLNTLGVNPAEYLIRSTGDWALRGLCLTLAVTPLRVMFNLPALARVRRMLGLLTFFYACLHLLCYAGFDMGLEFSDIVHDAVKRPFIFVGVVVWSLMLPLALTSWNRAIRWMGGKNWLRLHRLVYVCVLLALLHFFWMRSGKNDFNEVAVYAAIVTALLGWRLRRSLG